MNILEQTEALKDLPDQALVKEMQMPTGMAPPVFITAELKRRQRMRNEYKRREAQDMPTVAEEVVMAAGMPQGGIADAARAMAPKSSIAQNTGMNEMMPAAATRAPQRMAEGGIVRMAKGGKTQVVYNGVGYFVYADGDVQDAAGRAVNPELADKIKSSAGVGAEAFGSQPRYDADQLPFKDDGLTYGATVLSAADAGVDPFGVPQMMTSEDRDSSRMREAPAGDTSPSITNVSPSLEDVMGRELGPPMPEQFSSMDMVPSFDVGQLRTLADPEAMPASEQLPTRPRSLEPIYSETAYPEFSESTYEQGLESTPDTGEMQRPALPTIGSDPRISGNTEVGILPRGLQDLRSPQVDLDLVGGQNTRDEALRALDDRYAAAIAKAGSYDDLSPKERLGFAAERSMISPDRVLVKDNESPEIVSRVTESLLPPTATFGGDFLGESQARANAAKLKELRKTQPNVDVGTDPVFGDTMGLQEVLAGDFDPVPAPSNAKRDFDVMVPTIDRDSSIDQQLLSKALEAKSLPITPTEDFRREFADYGDDISPFDPADIADTTVSRGARRKNTGDAVNPFEGLFTKTTSTGNRRRGEVEEAPVSLTPTGFSPDPEALPLDGSVVDMEATALPPTLGGGDPAIERGIASALAQDVPAKNVVTAPTIDDGDDKKPTTPTTPSVTGTGSSPLRDRISRMLDEREANKESDKWMALAQTGLALMASKNPTIGGALGEAGLVGVGAMQKAKSSYDKDILSLLGLQEKMRTADLNYAAKVAKANAKDLPKPRTPAEVNAYLDYYQGEARRLGTVIEVDELGVEKKTYDPTKVPKSIRDEIFRLEEQYRTMFPSGATNLSD